MQRGIPLALVMGAILGGLALAYRPPASPPSMPSVSQAVEAAHPTASPPPAMPAVPQAVEAANPPPVGGLRMRETVMLGPAEAGRPQQQTAGGVTPPSRPGEQASHLVFGGTLSAALRVQKLSSVLLGLREQAEVGLTPEQISRLEPLIGSYAAAIEEEWRYQRLLMGCLTDPQRVFLGHAPNVEAIAGSVVLSPGTSRINPYVPQLEEALSRTSAGAAEAGLPALDPQQVPGYLPVDFLLRGVTGLNLPACPAEHRLTPEQARRMLPVARAYRELDDRQVALELQILGVLTTEQYAWLWNQPGLGEKLPTGQLLDAWMRTQAAGASR